ncbi:MAG TPA: CocE/NonD family hydrolase [Candidatus Cybelea sp.]
MKTGERSLNGPQTSGRTYRNLSQPSYEIDDSLRNQRVPVHGGVELLADVYLPRGGPRAPAIFSASPYPRQIQNSGAPLGFVEAGATDFFVSRGYVHVIANVRGTGGSGGTYDLFGPDERTDMGELVEWIAAQPWCDGSVGGVGVSAFAMTQLEAALEATPHLKAIFAPLNSLDVYELYYHGGVMNTTFDIAWVRSVAKLANLNDATLRSAAVGLVEAVLRNPRLHAKFAHFNGEAALGALKLTMRGTLHPPFSTLAMACSVEHQVKDDFWQARNMTTGLRNIRVPVYLGSDWQNVPVHLPSTFTIYNGLPPNVPKRMSLLAEYGFTWPWESLHVEALAWFDHWLRGRDTGIMDGPPIRYVILGEPGGPWHEASAWPPPECSMLTWRLRTDETLAEDHGVDGTRAYTYVSPALAPLIETDETMLSWSTPPLESEVRLVGPVELLLDASSTGGDVAFLVTLQDVAPDGTATDVTMGWRRAAISDDYTKLGDVPAGVMRRYTIRLVDNARCFAPGHRVRLLVRSDDTTGPAPMMGFHHAQIGVSSRISIASSSRLKMSVVPTRSS